MRLDQSLVRETNVMDYSRLYLLFAIIQLLLLKLWITLTIMKVLAGGYSVTWCV